MNNDIPNYVCSQKQLVLQTYMLRYFRTMTLF